MRNPHAGKFSSRLAGWSRDASLVPAPGQGQQAFVLDSREFLVGNYPFLCRTTATRAFLSSNTTESTPLADSKFRLPQPLGDLGDSVEILDLSFPHQEL